MRPDTLRTASNVLLILAILAVIIGLGVLAASTAPRNQVWSIALSGTAGHYERLTVDVLTGGSIAITFTTDNPVTIYVFTDAQHTAFLQTGATASLAEATGTTGSLSATLPEGGRYFVEITPASTGTPETGRLTVAITGINPTPFYVGVGIAAFGTILAILGVYYRGVARKRLATWTGPPGFAAAPYGTRPPWTSSPPPYVPGGMPPGASSPAGIYGSVPPATPVAAVPAPITGTPAAFGTIFVTVENVSTTREEVHILLNGMHHVSLSVPPGESGRATLRASVDSPAGANVVLEAVTGAGRRARQDVAIGAGGTTSVSLRIG